MQEVQKKSHSWEALYISKPDFHREMDLCYFIDNKLVGICAGHEVQAKNLRKYSIEILAVDPNYTKQGIAKKLLRTAFKTFNFNLELLLWTSSKEAYSFYKNHLKLKLNNKISINKQTHENKQYLFTELNKKANAWCFIITSENLFLKS
jgi:GNAT superfamily N-acetyltransferase